MINFLNMELSILDAIQIFMGSQFFDNGWVFITHLGDYGLIWISITIGLLVFPTTRKIGIACAIALFCGFIATNVLLKNLVARPRPYNHTSIKLLIDKPHDFSFPSGHTTSSFAVAFVLLRERMKVGRFNIYFPVIILAALVAFSRLYLYVHFPSDIIAGILVAYLCSITAFKVSPILKIGVTNIKKRISSIGGS